jgi:hypothetical protein
VNIFRELLHRGLGPQALVSNLGLPDKEWPFVEREIRELFKTWRLPEEGIPTFEESKEIKERTGTSPRYPARVGGSKGSSDVVGDGKWLHDKFDDRGYMPLHHRTPSADEKKTTVLHPAETEDQPDGSYEYFDESEEEEENIVEATNLAAFAGEIEVKQELALGSEKKYTSAEVKAVMAEKDVNKEVNDGQDAHATKETDEDRLRELDAGAASICSETPLLDRLALLRCRRTAGEGGGGGKCEVGADKSQVAKEKPQRRVLLRGRPEVEQDKKRGAGKLKKDVGQLKGKDTASKTEEDAERKKVKGMWKSAQKERTTPTDSTDCPSFALSDPYL